MKIPIPFRLITATLTAAALLATSGCGRPYVRKYEAAVLMNRQNIDRLVVGLTSEQVREVMGQGELVTYKKLRLSNPWHTESMKLPKGPTVLIYYYVVDGYAWKPNYDNSLLMPVVMENDRVVGWGPAFLERNADRYRIEDRDD